jgi:hypothetical protein
MWEIPTADLGMSSFGHMLKTHLWGTTDFMNVNTHTHPNMIFQTYGLKAILKLQINKVYLQISY